MLQYANGCLFFQPLLPFSPHSGVLPLERDPQGGSQYLIEVLETFLMPFLLVLDEVLDKRLLRTLLQCLVAQRTGVLSARL